MSIDIDHQTNQAVMIKLALQCLVNAIRQYGVEDEFIYQTLDNADLVLGGYDDVVADYIKIRDEIEYVFKQLITKPYYDADDRSAMKFIPVYVPTLMSHLLGVIYMLDAKLKDRHGTTLPTKSLKIPLKEGSIIETKQHCYHVRNLSVATIRFDQYQKRRFWFAKHMGTVTHNINTVHHLIDSATYILL